MFVQNQSSSLSGPQTAPFFCWNKLFVFVLIQQDWIAIMTLWMTPQVNGGCSYEGGCEGKTHKVAGESGTNGNKWEALPAGWHQTPLQSKQNIRLHEGPKKKRWVSCDIWNMALNMLKLRLAWSHQQCKIQKTWFVKYLKNIVYMQHIHLKPPKVQCQTDKGDWKDGEDQRVLGGALMSCDNDKLPSQQE